ncbi:MAG: protein translocase subunit SecD [Candidatus Vogelbacteria bacterium]|nr:protein translocase subunit SecD [Candidatus Vogelbacteria bacterium]
MLTKSRLLAIIFVLLGVFLGYFIYQTELNKNNPDSSWSGLPFKLGLDLKGGTNLIYKADISKIAPGSLGDSMSSLRDVIERRVNLFGVSEPIVQLEDGSVVAGQVEHRLTVDLPGVTDISQAVAVIGQTPVLEFKIERPEAEKTKILDAQSKAKDALSKKLSIPSGIDPALLQEDPYYVSTALTGSYLQKASLEFSSNSFTPAVSLTFNDQGTQLFADLTKNNVGKTVAIYLDGAPITTPVVREEIKTGKAQITGNFSADEAKVLVGRLNAGALPVPIELISTNKVGATLGEEALNQNVKAGIIGFLLVALFLIVWYRLPGLLATISLSIYVVIMLSIFKLIGVTLTAAGIAGFILTIGMAVDANILIFERIKEELSNGRVLEDAIREGFWRAWESIRDSNLSTIITSIILFWFGTSLIRGFALTLAIGVAASMFTAITVTRTILTAFGLRGQSKLLKFLFGHGLKV